MKIVIPGGTGHIGEMLNQAFSAAGHEVVVLTRRPAGAGQVAWDGQTMGAWADAIDGSDVVINLAGRSVSCRYTKTNLTEMMRSRVRSARAVGQAIAAATRPPRAWLQMSTATIYAHRLDAPNDEATGVIGGWEPGVPGWRGSALAARSPAARSTCRGFTGTISSRPSGSSSTRTTCRDRSTSPLQSPSRNAISCGNCAARGVCASACPRRKGWPSSARL